MNFLKAFLFLASLNVFFSCSKTDTNCISVDYDQFFTIEASEKYCFPDENYLIIENMENAFCPCDVVCVWEGEMILHYEAFMDNKSYSGMLGSSESTPNQIGTSSFIASIINLELEEPCNESNPSPDIKSAQIAIKHE